MNAYVDNPSFREGYKEAQDQVASTIDRHRLDVRKRTCKCGAHWSHPLLSDELVWQIWAEHIAEDLGW